MARDNTISATFKMAAGDGASAIQESLSNASFTSGDAILLQGTIGSSEQEFVLADYGLAQADGIYFENRDAASYIILSLRTGTGSGNDVSTLRVAAGGAFLVRCDDSQPAISHVAIQGEAADAEYVLGLAE